MCDGIAKVLRPTFRSQGFVNRRWPQHGIEFSPRFIPGASSFSVLSCVPSVHNPSTGDGQDASGVDRCSEIYERKLLSFKLTRFTNFVVRFQGFRTVMSDLFFGFLC